uniref:Uncharacterized protein LOC111111326 n=1 Tax=Crassostrea virginica TaxID=6565 RepID=A0A8B8BKU8_CRAVI|nr:uncharacterized protein LOC111111326 [Crassostrea virginica]
MKLVPWDVFKHHLKHHHGTKPLMAVFGLGAFLSATYPVYCLFTSADVRLWKRQRTPRYEEVDITKSKTIYTITPLVKRTGPVSEMEKLAHKAVGPHQYMYEDERN